MTPRPGEDPLVSSLLAAVAAAPDDVTLRLHVAGVLLERGRAAEALEHCSMVLRTAPTHAEALGLLRRAAGALSPRPQPQLHPEDTPPADADGELPVDAEYDWAAAEADLGDIAAPGFGPDAAGEPPSAAETGIAEVQVSGVRLADVGGMDEVKRRLELAFLGPMRSPELAKTFGKNLSGGLLLYGPPGCGKTFIARAVAGELGARFYPVGLADVLDMYLGQSERNIRDVFDTARRNAPCVVFLDEIDALGQKRSQLRGNTAMRTTVNQLLYEMDSVDHRNDGVFVLGATNHPWDVDSALRRPGRFDRMLLVLPPDPAAREAILQYHLARRPLAGINLGKLAKATDGFSGADLAHLCDTAAERALAESLRTGEVRPVSMEDFAAALGEVKPSTGPWLQAARNVAVFANGDGSYDDLLAYLKSRRLA
jgi:uncharacterized protein (TIGR02996 family)